MYKTFIFHSYANGLKNQLEGKLRKIKITSSKEDFREGMNAFLEKQKANFKGK